MPSGIYIRKPYTKERNENVSKGHLNSPVAIQASRNNILIAIEASSKLLRSEKQIVQLEKLHKLPRTTKQRETAIRNIKKAHKLPITLKQIEARRKNGHIVCSRRGSDSIGWRGGVSYEGYADEFNRQLKEKIRKRDNYQCQNKDCNMTEEEHFIVYGVSLTIHHIDYNKQNIQENNLISLCYQCNSRANFNRDYWEKYYQNIQKEREFKNGIKLISS